MNQPVRQNLYCRRPSLVIPKNKAYLLVWGDCGQWMVSDKDVLDLLRCFDTPETHPHISHTNNGARININGHEETNKETIDTIDLLMARGIISDKPIQEDQPAEKIDIYNVTVNITNQCNLSCSWCYNSARKTLEMPIHDMLKGIESGRALFSPEASFMILGGEPFLNKDRLLFAIDYGADAFSPAPIVSTNGTLIDEDIARKLSRRRIEVQVSIDSPDANAHDAIRGNGVFNKAIEGIHRLIDNDVYTIMSMVYTADSLKDLERYFTLAHELCVNEVRCIPLRILGKGAKHKELMPDQMRMFEMLLDILERRPEFRPLLKRDYFSILSQACRYSAGRTHCGIGRNVIFIDADGTIYPCPNFCGPSCACGNIRDRSLAEIISNSTVIQNIQQTYTVKKYTVCKDCAFRSWCAGDCRAEALAANKDPYAPSPHCAELKDLFVRMFWLIAENKPFFAATEKSPPAFL